MDRAPQPSPQLLVVVANKKPQVFDLTQPRLTLGRAEDNDIVIASPLVSRLHAELILTEAGYQINTLPGTGNTLMFNGRPLDAPHRLQPGDTLRIGSLDPVMMVSLTYLAPVLALANQAESIQFGEKNLLQIGRDPTNEVVLESPIVSRFHAQIELVGQRYRIRDLRSSNGTFINGRRVDGEARLQPEDSIQIGPYRFVVGQGRIDQYDESGGVKVEAAGLNKWVRNDLNILQDISVVFQPREFIVVVGQSGGGKSTLVDAIAGYRPATHGQVWVNGMDVYHCFDLIRNDIGFVPQRDIIHTGLTVYQAFDYAAQLRMPPDTSPDERCKRIEEVLVDLDLTHRKDVQISGLSGGQLKRVSIGVELLTKPRLFFLDEPTSGLDPGTETALMQLMRRLADQGRTIVLITHATKNVMLADKIIFLARGGYLAWFGPPEEALEYFDQYRSERDRRGRKIEFDDIYSILDNPHHSAPAEWAKRYQELPAFTKYIRDPLAGRIQEPKPSPVEEKQALINGRAIRQVNSLRQFFILSARNLKILTRDRFSLALMLATPILVGLLDVLVSILLNNNPFDFNRGKFPDVITTLFLLILYGIMVGGLAQMREIVKERDIYKRERLVNLKILPYILSKVWVAGLLALYQTAIYVGIHYLAFDMPGGLTEMGLIYITLALATMAGMMLGLFASALSPNANTAPLLLILLVLPQIVLGGSLFPIPPALNAVLSSRWAFEALMSITGIGSDIAADVCWSLPEEVRQVMTIEQKEASNCRCMGTRIFEPASCSFPGLGVFYNPMIDKPAPTEPAPLGDPPPEPVVPPRPQEPVDQSDSIAMSEFFNSLKAWEQQVNEIQEQYKSDLAAYQSKADVFKAESIAYQQALAEWQVARASSVEPAERAIDQFNRDFGWTFVDKNDQMAYWKKLGIAWLAQLAIIATLFVGILILQKRKDTV